MGRMERRVQKFTGGDLKRLGSQVGAVFSVYAIGRFAASVGQAADQIDNVAKATGASHENIQALNVLFQENGRAAGEALQVLGRLRKNLEEATVNEEYARSIQKLGLSFQDVASLGVDQVFERIAKKLQESAGDATVGEAAGNLLGRSYAELQGVMQDLATEGLDPLRDRLLAVNEIMSNESVRAADKMQEAYDSALRKMRTRMSNFLVDVGVGFAMMWSGLRGGSMQDAYNKYLGSAIPTVEAYTPEELARRRQSAARMAETLTKRQAAAVSSADDWMAQAIDKIKVGAVRPADSLAQIGGYIGGQSNPAAQMMQRQLRILEIQKEYQNRIAKATEGSEAKLSDISQSVED